MKSEDKFKCVGHLKIVSKSKDGVIKTIEEENNLIVDGCGVNILHGLGADGTATNYKVNRISLGTDDTAAAVMDLNITPPATSPTPVNVTISDYTNVGSYQIQFTGVLDYADGNGHTYHEAGLFMTNNAMIARYVFSSGKAKTSESLWTLVWTLTFTAA